MTKNITINAPEGTNIDGLQIEQTISQPADLEIGPVKVGDSSVLTVSNVAFVIIILGALVVFKRLIK
jgi:hypothetical protein|tara:strand:- start:458 stop:658 length:201 start_codon:yes stop_codon:yes gene_type:complete